MLRTDIIRAARGWLGTPWKHQASCRGAGVDCIGLIAGVAAECGSIEAQRFLSTPEWRCYGRDPDPAFMFSVADELMERIPRTDALPADVLVFRCGRHPMHFGWSAPDDGLVHAWAGARRVVEHHIGEWQARIVRAYRLRGVA